MLNIRIDKKYLILIVASAILILLASGFYVYKSLNNNENNTTGDENSSTKTPTVSTTNTVKGSGITHLGGVNQSVSKPGTARGSSKVVYTNAQVMAVLELLLGPLPKNYTTTMNGTEIKNGLEYYKVNVSNNSKSTLNYYVLPWEGKAYLLDPKNGSLIPVAAAKGH